MNIKRLLASLTSGGDNVHISFGYYTKEGEFTGISEEAELTKDEFYSLVKEKLEISFNPR